MTSKAFLPFLFALCSLTTLQAQNGSQLFDPSYVHELRFYFYEEHFWDSLVHQYDEYIDDSGVDVPYAKAWAVFDGLTLDTVGVRQKGLSSYFASSERKKPFKIDLNEFVQGQHFDGIKKFNLHNGACDPGMMRDFVGYNVLRTAGVKAPRMSFCRLYFNDEYWGLYGIIEQIDATFVNNHFAEGGGPLIKNIGWSELHWEGSDYTAYLNDFQLKTQEQEYDWSEFIHLLDVLNNYPDPIFPTGIEEIFNVDLYLHVMAADIMLNNWDSYVDNQRNWYFYVEPTNGKIQWIPWDYNLILGGDFQVFGNPYPPFDSACYLQATFSHARIGDTIFFEDQSVPSDVLTWQWDFGDGNTSDLPNPAHAFDTALVSANICLTVTRNQNGQTCESTRCKPIALSFDPVECPTIANGTCPYPATDPIFQQTIASDGFCCNETWDALCEVLYQQFASGSGGNTGLNEGVDYDLDFSLITTNPDKILITRLLAVPEYRQRYLDIACVMLENNFNAERLFPLIDQQVNLIRDAIYEDPNYIYTTDYFEYDTGNGTGGGGDASIPAIKWVLSNRFEEIAQELAILQPGCPSAFSPIGWHDLVINEIVASNDSIGGIADPLGGYGDWIELHNNTADSIPLNAFYLSDNSAKPFKWRFPYRTVIEPNGYLIVWADKDETHPGIHANFNLSKSGEHLRLMHEDGTLIDSLTFSEQTTNLGYARIPNGTGDFVFQATTFNGDNAAVGTNQTTDSQGVLNVYPNPAGSFLFVELKNASPFTTAKLTLRNALGGIVARTANFSGSIHRFDTAGLAAGVYFVEARQENGGFLVKKVLIQP